MPFRPCPMVLCREAGAMYVAPAVVKWRGDTSRTYGITPNTVPRPRYPTYAFPPGNPYTLGPCSVDGPFVIATLTFDQTKAQNWHPNYHACHEAKLEMTFNVGPPEDLI